jgi:hypothetical protein
MNAMDIWPPHDSVLRRYNDDPKFRSLVDIMTSCLWNAEYTPSELREAAIFAAMRVEAARIRPLIFDPNNYSIEYGVLKQVRDECRKESE